jgi:hypothetical protein
MKRLRINLIRAMLRGGLALAFIWGATASAEAPQGRPGVIRGGDECFQTSDIHGDDDFWGKHKVPCDDRYKDSEEIAFSEFLIKDNLKMKNTPGTRANWEAWQASASSGATTAEARSKAFFVEEQKQAEQHADVSKPFLHGGCQPNNETEENDKKAREDGCKFDEIQFQRNYWLALQGDHQAQEAVARCFENDGPNATVLSFRWPCSRVVDADESMMCAWYLVAMSSGHPDSAKSAEQYGYVYECDKKPLYVRQVILGTASELFLRIYHRPIPLAR